MTKRKFEGPVNCSECSTSFIPQRSTVTTCSEPCRREKKRKLNAIKGRRLYARNPEKFKARSRAKRDADPDKYRGYTLDHYRRNKEQYAENHRKWVAANREHSREWYRRYREATADRRRQYAKDNAERFKVRNADWRAQNPERWREYSRRRRVMQRGLTVRPFSADELNLRLSMFGFKCWICGVPYEAVDHVKPVSRGGIHALANLRPICKSCNSRKWNTWPFAPWDVEEKSA